MPRSIVFSDGQPLQGYGRGRPNPDEFSSTVNDVLKDSTYVEAEQKEKLQTVISAYNQRVNEINRLQGATFEVNRNNRLHQLTQEAQQDLKYLGTLNDYESTFNYWSKDLNGFLKNEFGGRVPPDIQAYVLNVKNQVEDKQIRILWDENQKKAFDTLSSVSSTFRQDLYDRDAVSAARNYQQLVGILNSFEESGVFDKRLAQNLKQGYERTYNDLAASAIMQQSAFIGQTHGFSHQKAYFDKTKNLIDTKKASPKMATAFEDAKKSLDEGEIDFTKRITSIDNTKDMNVMLGRGNPLAIKSEINTMLKVVDSKLTELHPQSKEYQNMKTYRAEMKSYTDIVSSFQDVVANGSASELRNILKPLGAKEANDLFDKLNITDPEEQQLFLKQHGVMTQRYGYKKDPIAAINQIADDFKKSSQDSEEVTKPGFVERLNSEYRNTAFLTGRSGISESSKKAAAEILNSVPNTPEDAALQQDVAGWFSTNSISMAKLMKDSQHPTIGREGLAFAMNHPDAFTYLSPDKESWTQIKQNFKSPGFGQSVDNLRDYYVDEFQEEILEVAAATGATVETVSNNMALNIVNGLTKGSNGGPLGLRGVGALSDGIPEDLEDRIGDLFTDMKDVVLNGYITRNNGATSILSNGTYGRALNSGNKSASLFSELITGESEINRKTTIEGTGSVLQGTANVNIEAPKISKADRVKFYKGMSDLTGSPQESFTNRVNIRQSQYDKDYYFFLNDSLGSQAPINYKDSLPFKGQIKISEGEMQEFLNKDLNSRNIVKEIMTHLLRTP